MYSNKAPSRDICQYLMAAGTEIAMKYNPREVVDFSIGDIVICNYGNHLGGEISGGHVHAIVCDVDEEGLIYAVPITKAKLNGNLQKYLPFETKVDVDYIESKYTDGTVLLKKGRYIRPERIQRVAGTTRPEFFNKLLAILPTTIQFSHDDYDENRSEKYGDVDNDDDMLFENLGKILEEEGADESASEIPAEATSDEGLNETPVEEISEEGLNKLPLNETSGEGVNNAPASDSSDEDMNEGATSNNTKKPSAEDYLATRLASSLENLDKSKPIEEQIDIFLNSIGFQTNERIIKQSFVAACEVRKIGYENIIRFLCNVYPKVREKIIKATIKDEFKKWLAQYPEAKEKYPKISFMVLLKVFARKMK